MSKPRYSFPVTPSSPLNASYWLLKYSEGAHSVLDIGCATGELSRHLTLRGSRVVGVELDSAAAALAKAGCSRVVVGDIETPLIQLQITEKFDAVVLGDVLEHLKSPPALLAHIRQEWLNPGGCVAASVPNSGHWLFRREVLLGRFPYREYGLFDRTHLRFYTRASLQALFSAAGYRFARCAQSVNSNSLQDITFACLTPLYRRTRLRLQLCSLEAKLGRVWPALFAYQFIVQAIPEAT